MFTVWEILLDHFETDHNEKCWEYLERRPPTEKLVEDFAYEFHLCPGISHDELRQLTEHFRANSELTEKLVYAKEFCEADAIRLLDNFPLSSELKLREIDFSNYPETETRPATTLFEVWRQDDNGNEFLISTFQNDFEARLLRKRLERGGHKQHYWVKARANDKFTSKP